MVNIIEMQINTTAIRIQFTVQIDELNAIHIPINNKRSTQLLLVTGGINSRSITCWIASTRRTHDIQTNELPKLD